MKIQIFDVDHGQCAVIYCPNGKKIMVDVGHNANRPWHPSIAFNGQILDLLIITNLDSDHVSGFSGMGTNRFRAILRNPSINSSILRSLKTDGFCDSMNIIYNWMVEKELNPGFITDIDMADWGGVQIQTFNNLYPTFDDTNNLSTATFISYAGFTILFPGDLEKAGWLNLLQNPVFRSYLSQTTIMVASHHGRENGCCDEVFQFCSPQLIIISDKQKEHETQETTSWYNSKATGIPVIGNPSAKRSVCTTRKDGHMLIDVKMDGSWLVQTERPLEAPKPRTLADLYST